MDVVIAGAGIGGLCAAVALKHFGHEPVVLEKAAKLSPIGAGLTVQPNAMLVLRRLGLADAVLEAGAVLDGGSLRRADGKVATSLRFSELPNPPQEPAVGIHRADLQRILLDAAGDVVRFGSPVSDVDVEEPAAILQGVAQVGGDVLVGADGIHSAVRTALWGPEAPRYAGYTCWRGICDWVPHELGFEAWGRGARFGAVGIGGGRTYWFATADTAEGGQDPDDVQAALLDRFGTWADPVPELLRRTPSAAIRRNDIIDRPPSPRWGRGATTLLGDAAHAMTPNMGQGACQAIEDAWVLARCLTEGTGPAAALRSYESERQPRTAWFVERSERLGRVAQWSHPLAAWLRDVGVAWTPASAARSGLARTIGYEVR
jgi:2-polyprenyl-6-methoxyphenol hydroxylase-like FAD-dependent oxidoreductase